MKNATTTKEGMQSETTSVVQKNITMPSGKAINRSTPELEPQHNSAGNGKVGSNMRDQRCSNGKFGADVPRSTCVEGNGVPRKIDLTCSKPSSVGFHGVSQLLENAEQKTKSGRIHF